MLFACALLCFDITFFFGTAALACTFTFADAEAEEEKEEADAALGRGASFLKSSGRTPPSPRDPAPAEDKAALYPTGRRIAPRPPTQNHQ